jgi:hypothetical protein
VPRVDPRGDRPDDRGVTTAPRPDFRERRPQRARAARQPRTLGVRPEKAGAPRTLGHWLSGECGRAAPCFPRIAGKRSAPSKHPSDKQSRFGLGAAMAFVGATDPGLSSRRAGRSARSGSRTTVGAARQRSSGASARVAYPLLLRFVPKQARRAARSGAFARRASGLRGERHRPLAAAKSHSRRKPSASSSGLANTAFRRQRVRDGVLRDRPGPGPRLATCTRRPLMIRSTAARNCSSSSCTARTGITRRNDG